MEPVTSLPHFDHFETERAGPAALLRINRPGKANALTAAFWPQLRGLLDAAAAQPGVRAVVLTGSGDRSFSAGGDIEAFAGLDGAAARRDFVADCLRTFAAIEECRLPVIAAVNGLALGGGCELALACDMVLAAEHAAFGLPEASVGLVPGFGILRAPSVLGRHTAKLMVLAGERISAQRAYELGLVQQVLPAGELVPAALRLGASARHDGARAAWGGVGVNRWDGQRLLENYVEQDYLGRRHQLAGDGPDPVEPPAVAPWDTRSVRADLAAEAVVRGWLAAGDITGVTVDDGHPAHRLVKAGRTDISVLFSAGPRVAFHAVRHGPLTGEDPRFTGDGEAMLHLAGVVRVDGGQVAGGRMITDPLGLLRRLTAGDYRGSSPGANTEVRP